MKQVRSQNMGSQLKKVSARLAIGQNRFLKSLVAVTLLLALLFASLSFASHSSAVGNGLVAAYGFNETSGNSVTDASGNNNNGTLSGTTRNSGGKFGSALSFNGSSNYVSIPDANSLDLTNGMTLEAWVKPTALGNGNNNWRTVIFKEQPNNMNYALYANNGTGRAPVGQVNIGGERQAAGTSQLALNTWAHLTTTYDGSNLRLYVNGALVSTTAVSGSITPSSGLLKIGGNGIWGEWYAGLIDEVRIYNRALTATEIQTDMNTAVTSTPDTTAPTTPTNFVQTASTMTSITTTWTASTDNVGVSGYGLYKNGVLVTSTSATSYTLSGLSCGTAYNLSIDAYDAAGNRSTQAFLTGSTTACDTTPPSVPSNFIKTSSTTTSITASWTASTDNVGVTGYGIYRSDLTSVDSTSSTSYTYTGMTCGTSYTLGVDAYDAAGNRSAQATIQASTSPCGDTTAPTPPTNLVTTGSTVNSISVSWTASTDNVGVTGYGMYNGGQTPLTTTTATSYTFTSLNCGTSYTLGVDAYDAAGNRSTKTQTTTSTAACPSNPGLVAAYGFNEGTGSTVSDASSSNNNGTTTSTTWSTTGKFGKALSFNGSSSYVSVADSNSLDLTNGMTLEAWVNPTALGNTSTSWRTVIFKEQPGAMNYAMYANNGTGARPVGQVNIGGEKNAAGTSQLTLNTWTHLATTYDGSNLKFYVNGVLVTTTPVSGAITPSTGLLKIGGNGIWGEYYSGLIDEVRVYSRALVVTEIQSDMNSPVGGSADTTPPTAPTSLAAIGSMGSASLSWSAATDNVGVTGYTVYRSQTSGFTASVATQIGTTTNTSYTDSGLSGGTYYYLVTAKDAAGNVSPASNEANATVTTDTSAPTVSITAPADGATVSGSVSLTATASDDVGVAGVQFKIDGSNVGSELTSSPYTITWGSASVPNGTHAISAVARDSAGNTTTSSTVTVTVSNTGPINPVPMPDATVNGITVGGGFVDASTREVVRTANNVVYVVAADDNPCQGNSSGKAVIHIWKGTGAQPSNPAIPTSFVEQDAANKPLPAGSGDCTFSSSNGSPALSSPDIRLDNNGIVHLAYIDMTANSGNSVYYQTYSTVTDTWGPRTIVGTNAMPNNNLGWPRQGQVALTLDANDVPHVVYVTAGSANQVMYTNKVSGSWSTPISLAAGTWAMHESMVTALDGSLHLTWLDNSQATHSVIKYTHYISGAWTPVETASSGDNNVLSNGDNDQSPSIATDSNGLPHITYLDGTVNGSDNYVRMRYRTTSGIWTDNSPPGTNGGASNPNGNWYTHTPQNYISDTNDDYVFLGHDDQISPGVYSYQLSGPGNNWSAAFPVDPRNKVNTTAGAPGIDGSASVRFDPLRDNNRGIIDLLYFDENDGVPGYAHHSTVYYKALIIK